MFGIPSFPLRLLPLIATPCQLLLLASPRASLTRADWIAGMTCAALFTCGSRWPLPVTAAQSALTMVAPWMGSFHSVAPLMACVALGELALRRRSLRQLVVGTVAYGGAFLVLLLESPNPTFVPTLFRMLIVVGGPIVSGGYLRSVRELSVAYRARAIDAEQRRESETLAVRAAERATIARELHDLVAHHVASIVLRVGVAKHVAPGVDPRLSQVLTDVHTTASTALNDLKRLVGVLRDPSAVRADLRAPLLDATDLAASLDTVVERTRRAGLPVASQVDPMITELDAVRRLAVLRVVQEGLTNALRHGGAGTRARLAVRIDAEGRVVVEVVDEGGRKGGAFPPGTGHGLLGMRERVELVGGSLDVGPTRSGWRVRAELPGGDLVAQA